MYWHHCLHLICCVDWRSHACAPKGIHCIAGLTALEKLVLVAPNDGMESDEAQGMPLALSDAALERLTKLTCLQLQASNNC